MLKEQLPDWPGKLRGTFELTNSIAGHGVTTSEDPVLHPAAATAAAGPSRAVTLHLASEASRKAVGLFFAD